MPADPDEPRAPDQVDAGPVLLRRWRDDDLAPFAAMNADPAVMRHIGSGPMRPADSEDLLERLERDWTRRGHGIWALERTADGAFLGFCGLAVPSFLPQVLPAVEIGWRLRREAWGSGYATLAARAALDVAWRTLRLAQVVAIVHPDNDRSMALAERLEMRVTGRTRHASTGWDVLVLRLDRPPGILGGGAGATSAQRGAPPDPPH